MHNTPAAIALILLTGLLVQVNGQTKQQADRTHDRLKGNDKTTEKEPQMRKLFLLASFLICLTSVNVFAQETPTDQKPETETERPKNAVDRALDEAKEKGETVIGTCVVDCEGARITEGIETGRILDLPKPAYPAIARAAHASGTVEVQVIIGLDGSIVVAAAISGHPLLQAAAVNAARQARFTPTKYKGEPVKVTGIIQYNFVAQ